MGQGETAEFLESQVKGEGLRGQLMELERLQQEKVRELGSSGIVMQIINLK